jgi:UDP-N-acetylglucosamine 4,6-dehydratase
MRDKKELLDLIGREEELFDADIKNLEQDIIKKVSSSSFLVMGGAGSIGQAVVKEIFKRNPKKLHVVDISENNMVELVRDLRSSFGYIEGEFKTFALDLGSEEYDAFIKDDGKYDYVMNLSALKHVRSEKDPYTLMRMVDVNIRNTEKTLSQSVGKGSKKYFCVSTDKATNPVNMMGASKKIMEMFLMRKSLEISVSTARFANVAFSDGSLLHGFNQRLLKKQPLAAPNDIKRYFVTPKESGELCLMSCLYGENRDIFFPKLSAKLHLITFAEIAIRFLKARGYEAHVCDTEEEARSSVEKDIKQNRWPCYFFKSDTTGEKDFEEFFTEKEKLEMQRFESIGIIKNSANFEEGILRQFEDRICEIKASGCWKKTDLVDTFMKALPGFSHTEKGKSLDSKM